MPYVINKYAICPRCKKKATGNEEIEKLFGFRRMETGQIIPQSHCRECRLEELSEKR